MHFQKLLSLTLFIVPVTLASPVEHASTLAPLYIPPGPAHDLVDDSYIVMFHDDILPSVFDAHISFLTLAKEWHSSSSKSITLRHVYNSEIAKGYSGKFTPDVLNMIRSRPEVKYIEQERIVCAEDEDDDRNQERPPWGLARISHRDIPPRGSTYVYPSHSGAGVMVYVLDTGLYIEHNGFQGRANRTDFTNMGPEDKDGHGTHVAGTIASKLYGVAKSAEIMSVKVLDHSGKGSIGDVVNALKWVLADSRRLKSEGRHGQKGFVVNMSTGIPQPKSFADHVALNKALNDVVMAGLHVVAAAGNINKDACNYWPAVSELVITVGATTRKDERWSDSNHGKCVDVFAPGHRIVSCGIGGVDSSNIINGTSMASAHVAGLVAHFLSIYPHSTFNPQPASLKKNHMLTSSFGAHTMFPSLLKTLLESFSRITYEEEDALPGGQSSLSPKQMKEALLSLATEGMITGLPNGTPNKLAYNNYTHAEPSVWDEEPFVVQLNN